MTTKSIKISEETYKKLVELAGKLHAEQKRPVSVEDAIRYLMKRKISDLAGSWDISNEEVREIKKTLRKWWKTWKSSA